MSLNKFLILTVFVFFSACNSNNDLLKKLNNNTELISNNTMNLRFKVLKRI